MDKEDNGMNLGNVFKIDRSMGERRSHQVLGGILFISVVLFAVFWEPIRAIFGS